MFVPIKTGDGSNTFYSETFGEWFHSKEGARNEAQKTYIEASCLAQRVRSQEPTQSLKILDICYGLGYNTAAALETIFQTNPNAKVEIIGLEIDIEVARSAIAQNLTNAYSHDTQKILQHLAENNQVDSNKNWPHLRAQLSLGDARQQIQPLIAQNWLADIIFLDPFSPPHCPQLWTVEFLAKVAQCLNPNNGVLVTYSCAAAVRSALKLAGLSIGSTHAGGRKWPGTIATYRPTQLPPLSQQEKEHLHTRAAVPYRDPTLTDTAKEILARRLKEQSTSKLLPTQPWRRRWKEHQQSSQKV